LKQTTLRKDDTYKSRIKFHIATVSIRYGCGHEQGRLSLGLGPCPTGNGEEEALIQVNEIF
jgi:hypothetical protein